MFEFNFVDDVLKNYDALLLEKTKLETKLAHLNRQHDLKLELAKRALTCIANEAGEGSELSILAWMAIDNLKADDSAEIYGY